jgi:hypothetical protein
VTLADAPHGHLNMLDRFGAGAVIGSLGERLVAATLCGAGASIGTISADVTVGPPDGRPRAPEPLGIVGLGKEPRARVPDQSTWREGNRRRLTSEYPIASGIVSRKSAIIHKL